MADCMMFPDDWRDFLKDYSFVDSEEVYTNGSLLIPVFRVEQLIENLMESQLHEQEPRVMTLEEADKAPYVWLESDQGGLGVRRIRIVPVDSTAISIQTFGRPDTICVLHEFEKHFRCWDKKPSDEQRQNTPWKE